VETTRTFFVLLPVTTIGVSSPLSGSVSKLMGGVSDSVGFPMLALEPSLKPVSRAARSGADLLATLRLSTSRSEMEIEVELVLRAPWLVFLLMGGQHLEASHGAAVVGPLGQTNIQSSLLEIDPDGSADSTNSGWMVVE